MSNFKIYRVLYNLHDSKMGFQNSITFEALSEDHALRRAMDEVEKCYGKRMFKRFTFKIDPSYIPQPVKA